jgi:hypothetical protein
LAVTASPETRVVHVTPIDVQTETRADGGLTFDVQLERDEGDLDWQVSTTGPPTDDYSELVEQSDHDLLGGILVMYIHDTVLIDETTILSLGNDTWPATVWDEISSDYFTGYHGAVSPRLAHGYLSTGEARYELLGSPKRVEVGQSWSYDLTIESSSPVTYEWTIDESDNGFVRASGGAFSFTASTVASGLQLREARADNDGGHVAVRYVPDLPALGTLERGYSAEVDFAIDIDEVADAMAGRVSVEVLDDSEVELVMQPTEPAWAVRNPMHVNVRFTETGHVISSFAVPEH